MDIVPLTPNRYGDWDTFSLGCDGAWFWHTTALLGYSLAYRPRLRLASESFMVIDGRRVQASCSLISEEHPADEEGTVVRQAKTGGTFGPPPILAEWGVSNAAAIAADDHNRDA